MYLENSHDREPNRHEKKVYLFRGMEKQKEKKVPNVMKAAKKKGKKVMFLVRTIEKTYCNSVASATNSSIHNSLIPI